MENAVEALGYAFGVLVFVIALTVSMNSLQQARDTSDSMFKSIDSRTYQENIDTMNFSDEEKKAKGRTVGVETIIPTLYRDVKENYIIEIYGKNRPEAPILRFDVSQDNTNRKIYSGSANVDAKTRLDILINGPTKDENGENYKVQLDPTKPAVTVDGIINNEGYNIDEDIAFVGKKRSEVRRGAKVDVAENTYGINKDGLYAYLRGKRFTEEYAYVLTEQEHKQEKLLERIEKIYIRYYEQ